MNIRKVYKYSLTGELLQIYESITSAAKHLKKSIDFVFNSIERKDIVDFEFTLERSIREPLAKRSEDPHSINIGDLQTLERYRDELIMLLNDKQQPLTPFEIKGINRELKNITNKLKS